MCEHGPVSGTLGWWRTLLDLLYSIQQLYTMRILSHYLTVTQATDLVGQGSAGSLVQVSHRQIRVGLGDHVPS